MSDIEEPPSKVSKMELNAEFLDDNFETGQEEWLTEEGLTDDEQNEQNNFETQDSTFNIIKTEMKQAQEKKAKVDLDMENTLNSLDSTNDGVKKALKEEPKELVEKSDNDRTDAETSDDGNDTDGLLRMLQDDDKKKKKKMPKHKTTKKVPSQDDSSDEDSTSYRPKITRLTYGPVVKTRPQARKAVPEDSDTDESDEADTVKKMFKIRNVAAKSTAKSLITNEQKLAIQKYIERREQMNRNAEQMNAQRGARLSKTPAKPTPKPPAPKPNSSSKPTVVVKTSPAQKPKPGTKTLPKSNVNATKTSGTKPNIVKAKSSTEKPNPLPVAMSKDVKLEEMEDESEVKEDNDFVEEDYGLTNEEPGSKSDEASKQKEKQNWRIMEPERMDEEVPTDDNSDDDDGSYYDEEMPTSDSDDLDDWFTLDLRSERAGEYIPMLGANARSILTEEKKRVGNRLDELRKSVIALSDSAKQQAEQIREATNTLNELEALIKAT